MSISREASITLTRLHDTIEEAIDDHIVPGLGIIFGNKEKQHELNVGHQTYESDSPDVKTETLYDVASLTKLFTTAAILRDITTGKISLHDSIGKILQSKGLQDVQIIHALSHASCLNVPFSPNKDNPDQLHQMVLDADPIVDPGTRYYYANINQYILGLVLEKLHAKKIDIILQEMIFDPLNMKHSLFNPPKSLHNNIAPTEYDPWRGRIIQGEVHDETAFAFGGITGYAGVFSRAEDIFKFGLLYLNEGKIKNEQYIDRELIRQSVKVTFPKAREAEGFNCRFGYSSFRINDRQRIGNLASNQTYEFSGFTGPAIFIDPKRDLLMSIVDNRTYPKRPEDGTSKHIPLLGKLFEIVCEGYPVIR